MKVNFAVVGGAAAAEELLDRLKKKTRELNLIILLHFNNLQFKENKSQLKISCGMAQRRLHI